MAVIVKNATLDNGIVTDLYYRMPYYKSNDKGFQCVCRVYASLDKRKEGRCIYNKKYVNIENPKGKNVSEMNAKEMYQYVYELLTKQLGGTAELEYSATEEAAQAAVRVQNEES